MVVWEEDNTTSDHRSVFEFNFYLSLRNKLTRELGEAANKTKTHLLLLLNNLTWQRHFSV